MNLGEPLKIGDMVQLKQNPMRGVSAVSVDYSWQILDGKVGIILAIREHEGNYAYILEIDGVQQLYPVWHWQIERLNPMDMRSVRGGFLDIAEEYASKLDDEILKRFMSDGDPLL